MCNDSRVLLRANIFKDREREKDRQKTEIRLAIRDMEI
jgi:hypothetical protein